MFPEPIPSPDPLDPMEGTCSHGNREECDKCDAERSAEDCDAATYERDELDMCLADCREIVGATSEDVRNDLRLLVEERDQLRRERDLFLVVVRHATQLIENEANWRDQAFAIVNNLSNTLARLGVTVKFRSGAESAQPPLCSARPLAGWSRTPGPRFHHLLRAGAQRREGRAMVTGRTLSTLRPAPCTRSGILRQKP